MPIKEMRKDEKNSQVNTPSTTATTSPAGPGSCTYSSRATDGCGAAGDGADGVGVGGRGAGGGACCLHRCTKQRLVGIAKQ